MSSNIRIYRSEKMAFAEVAKVVLKYALLGIAVGVFLSSPSGLSQIIPGLLSLRKKYGDKVVDKSLNKVVKDRFVKIVEKHGQTTLRITQKGKVKMVNFDIDAIEIQNSKWDGKWRFVIFDIPERNRVARDVLRSKLKEIGFVQIQKSVWASPYECEEEIAFISTIFGIHEHVNYIVADKIDHENYLRSEFDL